MTTTRLGLAGYGIQPAGAFSPITFDDTWYWRYLGNDANGGGFDATLGGTNYADQDSPQYTYASGDLTYTSPETHGTTAAEDSNGQTSDQSCIGNWIHITGGTNVIPGWYKIVNRIPGTGG